jgi:ketosteroid isomerase-like protein
MSQANVDIAKRAVDSFSRRDVAAYYDELFTPDYDWFPALVGAVDGDSFRGREGVQAYVETASEAWEELRVSLAEFRDLGDRVLCLGRMEGLGRGSGVPVEAPLGAIFEFRNGKISRMRAYLDHAEALRAAGLSE